MIAGIVGKGALAVFLSFLLVGSVAYAQGGPPPSLPQQLVITLSDGLAISEIFTASFPIVTRSISDVLSLDDSADPSKALPTKKQAADKITVGVKVTQALHAVRFLSERLHVGDPVSVDAPANAFVSNHLSQVP